MSNNSLSPLYEMANLTKDITGIEPIVFCSPKGGAKHECRVKVSNTLGKISDNDIFSIVVKDLSIIGDCKLSTEQLNAVKWWIYKNRFTILDYWEEKINTRDFVNRIKSIMEK